MELDELKAQYATAKTSDRFAVHIAFIKQLKSSNDKDIISYHYNLLRDKENWDFYLDLRAAFKDRGDVGEKFLVERVADETDSGMRADILTLLGLMRSGAALPLAREAVTSEDSEFRYRGCYVIGWMGKSKDLDLLRDRLLNDPDPEVRTTAATAYSQARERLPKSHERILRDLRDALESETDDTVAGWIIVTVQYVLKKRFGMKEDIEEGELTGDVGPAREKCLKALGRLDL